MRVSDNSFLLWENLTASASEQQFGKMCLLIAWLFNSTGLFSFFTENFFLIMDFLSMDFLRLLVLLLFNIPKISIVDFGLWFSFSNFPFSSLNILLNSSLHVSEWSSVLLLTSSSWYWFSALFCPVFVPLLSIFTSFNGRFCGSFLLFLCWQYL